MNEKIRTVMFSILATAVFTFMLSGVNALLKERIDRNRTIARQKVILALFGLLNTAATVGEDAVPSLFAAETLKIDLGDSAPECYRLKNSDSELFVVAFKGQGFWDNIFGFIALDMQSRTISGIEFTQHGETPGLGGRISEAEFKARFKNKPFAQIRLDGLRLKVVAEGSAANVDEIDGITGATGTSNAIEKIVNNTVATFIALKEGRAGQ
ncbi:MAG: FMN-binding protein [Erysipelotrichia bacterium]|nr:FMN-binding protein [Erysipelotrichia bacterium]